MHPKIFSILSNSMCISANNILECKSYEKNRLYEFVDKETIPSEFNSGVDIVKAGYSVNCASKRDLFMCWGSNEDGLLDIPSAFRYGVDLLGVGYFNVCARIKDYFNCWGSDFYNNIQPEYRYSINYVPDPLKSGVELIIVQWYNACALKEGKMYCWGLNIAGINNVPIDYIENVTNIALGDSIVCAYNGVFGCWGAYDEWEITNIPANISDLTYLDNFEFGYGYACVSSESRLQCWGTILPDSIPDYYYYNIDFFSLGEYHTCISKDNAIRCYDNNGYLNISDQMRINWSLPSLKQKISFVYHSETKICIFKGSLMCYYYQKEGFIKINTPDGIMQSQNVKIAINGSICGINMNGTLICWSHNSTENYEKYSVIPDAFNSGTKLFEIGYSHICANSEVYLECWGGNEFGEIDIPEEVSGVTIIAAYLRATCINTPNKLICFGILGFSMVDEYYPISLEDFPENFKTGVDSIAIGEFAICTLKNYSLFCWGYSLFGILDIPEEFRNDTVELISIGSSHACAQSATIMNCWGRRSVYDVVLRNGIPSFLKNIHFDILNSCRDTNCGRYNGEWVCWGFHGIPLRLYMTEQFSYDNVDTFDITDDYDICLKKSGYIDCYSNKYEIERYSIDLDISESLMCMYIKSKRTYICYVEDKNLSKFKCILAVSTLIDRIRYEYMGDSNIVKVSCGTNHGCALFESGEVHCFGGITEAKEADLSKDMIEGVYDVRACHNSTCVLKSSKIICKGEEIFTNKNGYNLTDIKGFDEIIKLN